MYIDVPVARGLSAASTESSAGAAPEMNAPVRVVAVTQDDPFFTGRFFRAFLEQCRQGPVQLVEIVLLRNFNESRVALARRLWKFYGTWDMLRLLARYAASRIADRLGTPRGVEAQAQRAGVPIRHLASINDEEYLRSLGERHIDVLLSVSAPEIFRASALNATPHAINIHNGKLPFYRGMMPTFWALLNEEPEITITVHTMVEKLDAGRVLAEYRVPIGAGDSQYDLSTRAKDIAGREVAGLLARLGTPEWPEAQPVDMTHKRYFKFPTADDVARLRAKGRRML